MALPAFGDLILRAPLAARRARKAVRFGWALAAGAAPLLLAGLARMALPGFDRWMLTGAGTGRLAVDASSSARSRRCRSWRRSR